MQGVEPLIGTAGGPFGGTAGRLLRGATGPGSAFTGFVLGVALLSVAFVCRLVRADAIGQLLGQILMAAALGRFALNGYSGEDRGTILSTAGGSWPQALAVAGRYLTLQLLWVVPVLLLGWSAVAAALPSPTDSVPIAAFGGGAPAASPSGAAALLPILGILSSRAFLWSAGLLFFGMLFVPPVALIVAVRAAGYGDMFRGALWRETFGGRLGDLYTLFVVQAGGVGMGAVVMLPLVLIGFAAGYEIGVLFTGIAIAFLAGLAVSLLGRLCGFFAFGDESKEPVQSMAPEGGAGGPEAFAPPEAGDDPQETRPPLLDAETAVAAARKQAETDAQGALAALEALCEAHPPHPLVLHARALLLRAASRPEALPVAGDAIRLALKRGVPALATELFAAFWKEARRLDLKPVEIDAIGAAFQKSGDLGQAAAAFGLALNLDRSDRPAVKGLMKIADQRLYREGRPKDAARIYTFLLQYAPDSPFAEDIKRELAEAEGRLKRAV
jgi:hypothetical protein